MLGFFSKYVGIEIDLILPVCHLKVPYHYLYIFIEFQHIRLTDTYIQGITLQTILK